MKNSLNSQLAKKLAIDSRTAGVYIDALAAAIKEAATEQSVIAIPAFGTFATMKTDEHIVIDSATGKRTLMPPAITFTFKPSVLLRKKMR